MMNFVKRSVSLLRHPELDVYYIDGQVMDSPFRLLVVDDSSTISYIRHLVFPQGSDIIKKTRVSVWKAADLIDVQADLVVVGANLLLAGRFTNRGFYLVPKWVQLNLPITDHPDAMISRLSSKSAREDIKRNIRVIRERGYTCETTGDPAWFESFYHRMYKPYAINKYGETAVVHDYRKLKASFKRGRGIIIKKWDQPVAGTISLARGDTLYTKHLGILDGDEDFVRDGAVRALYYHTMVLAYEWGIKNIDFGHSRPFLSDGVLKYKLKWDMEVRDDDDAIGVFAVASPQKTELSLRFLAQNRFFHLQDGSLKLLDDIC
jgi:hypothetical protein